MTESCSALARHPTGDIRLEGVALELNAKLDDPLGNVVTSKRIVEGLERCPDALNLLFNGGNTGKVMVKL